MGKRERWFAGTGTAGWNGEKLFWSAAKKKKTQDIPIVFTGPPKLRVCSRSFYSPTKVWRRYPIGSDKGV